ncbi:ankyrin repeat [Fusarium phyllophilum]|uniref:Ankyrin repeat n=1 Tax=Fusarium phyllophilum TaxID=47803 RepID=A0A8H5NIC1_9HYPO|nr:ankyrin repeat [Fusarium phyllophilum]
MDNGADPNQTFTDKAMLFINVLKTNNPELIKLFLDYGAKCDSYDSWESSSHRTPLTHAVHCNTFNVVKLLLDYDASPNYCPNGCESALQAAAWEGGDYTREAELLLERDADLDWVLTSDGWTPLQTAYDSPKLVRLFTEHGADVERQCDCGTVLMMAARWGFIETVRILITYVNPQPDLDASYRYEEDDDFGNTAFDFALMEGYFDIANLLLDSSASLDADGNKNILLYLNHNLESRQVSEAVKSIQTCFERGMKPSTVDKYGNTHLHSLGSSTSVPVIQALIDGGAPIDTANKAGRTPLAVAVECGNLDAAKLLLLKHARPDIWIPDVGNLLFLACQAQKQPARTIINILKLLIEAKVDPHLPGPEPDCRSLLYTAILHPNDGDRQKLVQYLIGDVNADINGTDGSQFHPVIVAADKLDTSLFEYLLRHGAKVGVIDSLGLSLLHYAIFMDPREPRIFSLLKKSNADFRVPDKYGRTPLHLVAALGYTGDIEWLLRQLPDLDLDVKYGDGWAPLMWACKLDATNSAMVEWLIDRGVDYWAKSIDGAWSAHKLACLSNMDRETLDLLQPPKSERERVVDDIRETWDPLFHQTEPGIKHPNTICDGCLMTITGPRQKCTTCEFDLCFKCFPHRLDMHDPNHEFNEFFDTDNSGNAARAQSTDSDGEGTASNEKTNEEDSNVEESQEGEEGRDGQGD